MTFEEEINKATEDKYCLKLKSATLKSSSGLCSIEMFYKDGIVLGAKEKQELEQKMVDILPRGFTYDFKLIKNFVVDDAIFESVNKLMKNDFPSLTWSLKKVDCEKDNKVVEIAIDENELKYAEDRGIKKAIENALFEQFDVKIDVVIEKQESVEVTIEEELPFIEEPVQRFISVSNLESVVGNLQTTEAFYIKDKKSPEEDVVFCGRIGYIKEYSYTPKKTSNKDKEKAEEEEGEKERKFFKFTLEDFSGKMPCVIFATKKNYEQLLQLKKDDSIIVSGSLSLNNFSQSLDLKVKDISRCILPEKFEEEIIYKDEPENYRFVFPEKVEYYSQVDLFTVDKQNTNEFFLENDVVVFDFETTGLRLDGNDKIVEIGAVKVVKGKIVESFSCLIDPQMHIPEDSTKTHGITDDDVKGKPTYEDVLPDFYKFTRNCYLSGYNIIGFDMIFLTHFGKLCGYNFDNKIIDVYKIAQKQVRGVKNYKLGTIAEKLGVELDHAHRAVFDTIATAEVLLKLSENMGKDDFS